MFFVKPVGRLAWFGSGGVGQAGGRAGWLVGLAGAEHGEDDVAAAAGQADQGGVVAFAFGAFAVVEGLGRRVAQGGERGEEHGVLEPVVASSALRLALERRPRLASHGSEAGVAGEFAAVGERGAVADLGEDPGAGARPDAGKAQEQLTERVRAEDLLDLDGEVVASAGWCLKPPIS